MHKRHAASKIAHLSMCGYECTPGEYQAIKKRGLRHVNCKRCLELLR